MIWPIYHALLIWLTISWLLRPGPLESQLKSELAIDSDKLHTNCYTARLCILIRHNRSLSGRSNRTFRTNWQNFWRLCRSFLPVALCRIIKLPSHQQLLQLKVPGFVFELLSSLHVFYVTAFWGNKKQRPTKRKRGIQTRDLDRPFLIFQDHHHLNNLSSMYQLNFGAFFGNKHLV